MSHNRSNLPQWGQWFLKRLLSGEDYEFFSGDLEESLHKDLERKGCLRARLRLHIRLSTIIIPILMSKLRWTVVLIANDLKITTRNIKKHRVFSLINITGLAISLAFFILLISYVKDEWSYDRFHAKASRIYMTTVEIMNNPPAAVSAPILAEPLRAEFPEIVNVVRYWCTSQAVKVGTFIQNQDVALADPGFFSLFDFPFLSGLPGKAIDAPYQVVLTEESASRIFGTVDPVGKVLSINMGNQPQDFMVRGVLERIPGNSSIQFDLLVSFDHISDIFQQEFTGGLIDTPFFHATFLELHPESNPKDLKAKFPGFVDKYYGAHFQKFEMDQSSVRLGLYRFQDFHLGPMGSQSLEGQSRPLYSWILFGIALVVLLLACSNYMNLSLGLSSLRLKEIGAKKVLGAGKIHLIRQFINESLLLSIFAVVLSSFMAVMIFPRFNQYTGKTLSIDYLINPSSACVLLGLLLLTGLISGIYPALILSRLKISDIFSGKLKLGGKNILTRSLLIFQSVLTIFMVAGSLIMIKQISYLTREDLGYDYRNVVAVPTYSFWNNDESGDRALAAFQRELEKNPEILAVAGTSGYSTPMGYSNRTDYEFQDSLVTVAHKRVDYGFLEALKIPLLQGKNFSRELSSDIEDVVIVNQALVRRFGLKDPVGKNFSEFAKDTRPGGYKYTPTIIGVIQDFHFASLHQEIGPMMLNMRPEGPYMYILVCLRPGNPASALTAMQEIWKETIPNKPFSPVFLDDTLKSQYRREQNWGWITRISTAFAVLIAGMGLFGLTALTISRRTKEIGIRRVLGANIPAVLSLISRDLIVLILIANAAAWPMIYWAASNWLQSFAYRTPLALWIFPLAGAMVLCFGMIIVCVQVMRSCLQNPANSLRNE
ncbi:MAG: ABC transporter permease [Candidatus Aminicenantes bacterium]|nr:ABC transporter permease [Candidatus Aminicenantes bacterium]